MLILKLLWHFIFMLMEMLQYKFFYGNEMLFFYGKCILKSGEQKCNKCVILQSRLKKEARDYLWEFSLVFSYVLYLFISVINADVKNIRVKPKISHTHINQWDSQHLHEARVTTSPSRTDCEVHSKMSWKHTSSKHQYRDANKPYRSYLITTRTCALSLTA